MTIRQALPEDVTNLDDFNKSGMYYGHNQDGHITGMPFNDGDFILLIYADERWDTNGQYFYNGNVCTQILIKCGRLGESEHIYVRASNFNEMGNIIHHGWTEIETSSPTMYIHVTSEEKDGKTVYKSDKTYEEIKEAIDSGKSPVVIYNSMLFNYYENNFGSTGTDFVGDVGCVNISKASVDFVQKQSLIALEIIIQDAGESVINCKATDLMMSMQVAEMYYGIYPQLVCSIHKNNTNYNVVLSLSGGLENSFIFSTVANINGKLTYYSLNVNDPEDTSIWDYTETEMPVNITDEHINTLIDKKLGVIENGTY